MKTIITAAIFALTLTQSNYVNGQEEGGDNKNDYKISFVTDVNFTSASNDSRKESKAGIGTLGINFEREYLYGGATFTVYSQNSEITSDSGLTKIFGTNLLLPQNSSGKLSNFHMQLGVKTFCFKKEAPDRAKIFSLQRFGFNVEFRVNNNTWNIDTITTPVTITSSKLNFTYMLLNAEVLNTKERIKMILFGGLTTRRIGGDMGLKSNTELRKSFLGTDSRGFNGLNYGVRLEVSKFYGEMNITTFGRKDDIAGFSGDQALITLGLKADLTLFAEDKGVGKK